jgi:hypothetical protein
VTGCATITRGGSETLIIESDPGGANVTLSSGKVCATPCFIAVKRTQDYHVKIEKPDYQTIDADVVRKVTGAGVAGFAGNLIFGGPIGMGVDLAKGSTKKLTPNPLRVKLEPIVQPTPVRLTVVAAAVPIAGDRRLTSAGPTTLPQANYLIPSMSTPHPTTKCAALGIDMGTLAITSLGGMDGVTGAMVTAVAPHSAAAQAGIRQGDILLRVGDASVDDPGDVQSAVVAISPGAIVPVKLSRQARPLWVNVQF